MKMMAMIGFIMIAASGFAEVMKATGEVKTLVETSAQWIDHSKGIGALLMLLVGLVTMGIGSSFSTVPILAAIFVPLCVQLGFDPLATVCIVGTAGAGRCRFAGLGLDPGPDLGPERGWPAPPYLGHRGADLHPLQPAVAGVRLVGGDDLVRASALVGGGEMRLSTVLPSLLRVR
jgi:hypothetical protein